MATSVEISDLFGNVSGSAFNDYDTASKGKKKISKVSLYQSGNKVVGIKTMYLPNDERSHGDVSGSGPTEIPLGADQYIIAAFVAVAPNNDIVRVLFNIANTQGEVERKGIEADTSIPGQVGTAFGNIIAFHGTKGAQLTSLGFQVLQSR